MVDFLVTFPAAKIMTISASVRLSTSKSLSEPVNHTAA